jgi:phosphopantothenoylcysteine synthetase/decarboxylase
MSQTSTNPAENSADASKTVVLAVCGSIAAYKSADITSRLAKRGHQVFVVFSDTAEHFINPLTLQTLSRNPVLTSLFDEKESWRPGHIELADTADLLLVAPASANSLAEMAHGLARSGLGSIYLATRAPVLAAPAMNGKMWLHPATQKNVAQLKEWGVEFIGPREGMLACGYQGIGRLWEVDEIVEKAVQILDRPDPRKSPEEQALGL